MILMLTQLFASEVLYQEVFCSQGKLSSVDNQQDFI